MKKNTEFLNSLSVRTFGLIMIAGITLINMLLPIIAGRIIPAPFKMAAYAAIIAAQIIGCACVLHKMQKRGKTNPRMKRGKKTSGAI